MTNISSFEELEREIERTKQEFYGASSKNTFLKKQQKFDCAKQIVNNVSIDALLKRMCFIIDQSNVVHIDYPIMKTFASPENFGIISDYIISQFQTVKTEYPGIEVALNFDGFTISAAERYKDLIQVFCQRCFQYNTDFAIVITRFTIYNSPNIFDNIKHLVVPFIDELLKPKIVTLSKSDSASMRELFSKYGRG